MDGGAKESSRAGDRARRSGQQRVHRRIGGTVALLDDPRGAAALARDRREHGEEPADRDDREARRRLLSILRRNRRAFRCREVPSGG